MGTSPISQGPQTSTMATKKGILPKPVKHFKALFKGLRHLTIKKPKNGVKQNLAIGLVYMSEIPSVSVCSGSTDFVDVDPLSHLSVQASLDSIIISEQDNIEYGVISDLDFVDELNDPRNFPGIEAPTVTADTVETLLKAGT